MPTPTPLEDLPSSVKEGLSSASLEDAIRWLLSVGGRLVASYAQDEYTHDVVFFAAIEGRPLYLVFDTT